MSGGEIILIMLFVLIFFGADKIPEIARGLGKGLREFRKAADEIKSELINDTADIRSELNEIRTELVKNTSEVRQEVEDIKTEVQHNSPELGNEIKNLGQNQDTSYDVYEELKEDNKTSSADTDKNNGKAAGKDKDDPYMGAYI